MEFEPPHVNSYNDHDFSNTPSIPQGLFVQTQQSVSLQRFCPHDFAFLCTTISQNLRGSRRFPFPHLTYLTHLTHLTLVAALPRWVHSWLPTLGCGLPLCVLLRRGSALQFAAEAGFEKKADQMPVSTRTKSNLLTDLRGLRVVRVPPWPRRRPDTQLSRRRLSIPGVG